MLPPPAIDMTRVATWFSCVLSLSADASGRAVGSVKASRSHLTRRSLLESDRRTSLRASPPPAQLDPLASCLYFLSESNRPAMLSAAVLISSSTSAYVAPVVGPRMQNAVARANAPAMDETIIEKALAGELEEEGAENVFMSELGWATYLDQNAGSSYNMNERPSIAQDGYFTADIFSGPGDGTQRCEQLMAFSTARPLSFWLAAARWALRRSPRSRGLAMPHLHEPTQPTPRLTSV
jgi:hypothetical protein